MTRRNWSLCLILAALLSLCGCNRSTVVILPPQTADTTQSLIAGDGNSTIAEATTEGWTEPYSCPETAATDSAQLQSDPAESNPPTTPESTSAPPAATNPPKPTEPPTAATSETCAPPVSTIPPDVTVPPDTTGPSVHTPGSLEYAILAEINAYRQDYGLEALRLSQTLCGIAYLRGQECAQTGSRVRPNGTAGVTILGEYGVAYDSAGEIVTVCSADSAAADVVARWMANEEAGNTLLSPAFDTVGIGVYTVDGISYISCLFVG